MSSELTIWRSADGNQTITWTADKGGFRTTCPNGHKVDVAMSAADVRDMLAHYDENDRTESPLEMLCTECGRLFLLPVEAMPNLRRWAGQSA
jgi:hypothetical protein